jgi:hypothetical protein
MATTPAAGKIKRAGKTQRLDETPSSPVLVGEIVKAKQEIARAKSKGGRPTLYSQDLAYEICEGIVEGKSLRKILSDDGMPSIATVFRWLDENEWFRDNYMRAKDNQADTNAEDIQELVADVRSGKIDPQSARVAGDLLKWSSSKLKPKKYGDKLDLTSDGKQMPAPIISIAAVPQNKEINS